MNRGNGGGCEAVYLVNRVYGGGYEAVYLVNRVNGGGCEAVVTHLENNGILKTMS